MRVYLKKYHHKFILTTNNIIYIFSFTDITVKMITSTDCVKNLLENNAQEVQERKQSNDGVSSCTHAGGN